MDHWKIQLKVQECAGILVYPNAQYTLVLKLGNTFSSPSLPANIISNKLRFGSTLVLQSSMTAVELSFTHLQIMIVMTSEESNDGASKNQQIIGIATIQISYPLPKQLTNMRLYSFDKSFDLQGKIQAQLFITKSIQELKQKGVFRKPSLDSKAVRVNAQKQKELKNITAELLSLQQQQNNQYKQYVKFIQKQLNAIKNVENNGSSKDMQGYQAAVNQKNQLFKLSEDLYEELKKCMNERDQYLKQLRQKILSEEELQKQIDMLKFRVEEYELACKSAKDARMNNLKSQLQQKQTQNNSLLNQNENKEKKIKQLERKVKQCLKAIDQFRNQALSAQNQLIHKASELSVISKYGSKGHPSSYECIEDLAKELQCRRHFTIDFSMAKYNGSIPDLIAVIEDIRKDISTLFSKLMTRTKNRKDKDLLMSQKIQFEKGVESKLSSFLNLTQ